MMPRFQINIPVPSFLVNEEARAFLWGVATTLFLVSVPYLWNTPNPVGFAMSVPASVLAIVLMMTDNMAEKIRKQEREE